MMGRNEVIYNRRAVIILGVAIYCLFFLFPWSIHLRWFK